MQKNNEIPLQKQLEFYTNLLAEHEKKTNTKNLKCTSYTSNKSLDSRITSVNANDLKTKPRFKITKPYIGPHADKEKYSQNYFSKFATFQPCKKFKLNSPNNAIFSTKTNTKNFSSSKLFNISNKKYENYDPSMKCGTSKACINKVQNTVTANTHKSFENKSKKSDSEKLIKDIFQLTQQLKLKSHNINSGNVKANHIVKKNDKSKLSNQTFDNISLAKLQLISKCKKSPKNIRHVIEIKASSAKDLDLLKTGENSATITKSVLGSVARQHTSSKYKMIKTACSKTELVNKTASSKKQLVDKMESHKKDRAKVASSKTELINTESPKNYLIKTVSSEKEQAKTASSEKEQAKTASSKNELIKTASFNILKELGVLEKALNHATVKNIKTSDNNNKLSNNKEVSSIAKEQISFKSSNRKLTLKRSVVNNNNTNTFINNARKSKSMCFPLKLNHQSSCDKNVPKMSHLLNSKYKIVNKVQTLPRYSLTNSVKKTAKKYRRISMSAKKNVNSFIVNNKLNTFSNLKNLKRSLSYSYKIGLSQHMKINKLSSDLKQSPFISRSKYHLNKTNKKFSKLDVSSRAPLKVTLSNNDVDVDLLLELAAEKKNMLLKQQRHVNHFKNRSIFINSAQTRMVKMIKSKYFNTNKKFVDWRCYSGAKCFKGACKHYTSKCHFNKTSIKKMNGTAYRKFRNKNYTKLNLPTKRIVNVGSERFIIGSSGKSLKKINKSFKGNRRRTVFMKKPLYKITLPKYSTPVSKLIASRALNRSINQALSSSAKKKLQKVNVYCMFYNRFGRCNKGVKCPYVHDPSKIAVCTRFLRGTCKNDKCLFSHEINPGKMAICSFYLKDECTKENCPYRHEKLSPDAQLCKAFVQGYCSQGKQCKKAHILICPKYIQGICDKGKDCVFPHPVDKNKKIESKLTHDVKKIDDQLLETVCRYYQSNSKEEETSGSVIPKRQTLTEQPSFISLTMDEAQ